jgi:hypothetical protein
MGPTIFLPRTNTDQAHLSHQAPTFKERESFLVDCEYRISCLKKGDAAIMDSRCLHFGDANTFSMDNEDIGFTTTTTSSSEITPPMGRRVLMYFTVRNPKLYHLSVPPIPPGSKWKGLDIKLSDFRKRI